MADAPTTIITQDEDMVDAIAFRHYGTSDGTPEAILDANPGLAARGPVLPAGLTIVLPPVARPVPGPAVTLYD